MKIRFLIFGFLLVCFELGAMAQEEIPKELEGVGIGETLGQSVTLSNQFIDENGDPVELKKYFDSKRPVILTLVYYECPNLCTFVLNELLEGLKKLNWTVGREFQIVSVSINPKETPSLAKQKKEAYLASYLRDGAASGWHFLTGTETAIQQLAQEVGFGYKYDERQKQYAHAAGIFILTPDGQLSRILYGITYTEKDLKLGLLEASAGRIGTLVDKLLLFCYHYDPQGKRYALFATNLMKGAAGVTVVVLVLGFGLAFRSHKRKELQ